MFLSNSTNLSIAHIQVTMLLDNMEFVIIPVVNPDGYVVRRWYVVVHMLPISNFANHNNNNY